MDILALRTQGPGSDQAAALPIMRAPGELQPATKKSPCWRELWLHACLLAYSVSSHHQTCVTQPNPLGCLLVQLGPAEGIGIYWLMTICVAVGDLLTAKVTPQDHANYALTWYSLSAATAMLALRVLRNPGVRS